MSKVIQVRSGEDGVLAQMSRISKLRCVFKAVTTPIRTCQRGVLLVPEK